MAHCQPTAKLAEQIHNRYAVCPRAGPQTSHQRAQWATLGRGVTVRGERIRLLMGLQAERLAISRLRELDAEQVRERHGGRRRPAVLAHADDSRASEGEQA